MGDRQPPHGYPYAVTGHVARYVALSRGRYGNRVYAVVGEATARDEFAPASWRHHPLTDRVGRLERSERSERQLITVDERYAAEYAEMPDLKLRRVIVGV